jgi:hypothetical protein
MVALLAQRLWEAAKLSGGSILQRDIAHEDIEHGLERGWLVSAGMGHYDPTDNLRKLVVAEEEETGGFAELALTAKPIAHPMWPANTQRPPEGGTHRVLKRNLDAHAPQTFLMAPVTFEKPIDLMWCSSELDAGAWCQDDAERLVAWLNGQSDSGGRAMEVVSGEIHVARPQGGWP